MKRAISLVLILLMVLSIGIFAVSCNDVVEPLEEDTNTPTENNKENNNNNDPDDLKNPSLGNDKENTWNEDGNAIGHPVPINPTE